MSFEQPSVYGATDGSTSSIGTQFRTDYYHKKALKEAAKEQYFGQMSSVTNMPKNMGKTIKKYHYLPLLDDRNINDQGIDANGVVLVSGQYSAVDANGDIISSGHADEATALAVGGAVTAVQDGGNLYGSSKDVGAISGKLPVLGEAGGRVNRVGFKRMELEGSMEKFGFFDEYTKDSLDFDTDAQLQEHVTREMVMGANEMTEDALQIDLLNSAGVVIYGGQATQDSEVSGEAGEESVVTYESLMKLHITLSDNRTPLHTTIINGSRLTDTKTVNAARFLYCGTAMIPTLRRMTDLHGNPAFISVEQYAAAGNIARGEIGTVADFRVVIVPEMQKWAGQGKAVSSNNGYQETANKYDIHPMLVIGDQAFTTIGFQTDGKSVKFTIYHKAPGEGVADRNDPYGEVGFMSIKWWYGFLLERPERIAVIKSVAEI